MNINERFDVSPGKVEALLARLREIERARKRKSRRAERAEKKYGAGGEPAAFSLPIGEGFYLSDLAASDKAALVAHLQEKEIYDHTLAIPRPYTETDADKWLAKVSAQTRAQGRSLNWAIREPGGGLIGSVGYHDLQVGKSREAEIGYWLAKPFWNRGLMTRALRAAADFALAKQFRSREK